MTDQGRAAKDMTADEHIAKARGLLAYSDMDGLGWDLAAGYATRASAHLLAALVIIEDAK